jgi:NTE family protein
MTALEKIEHKRADRGAQVAWPPSKLSLALQGGGSFGAFTWGVLDRLLEEDTIEFDAVSGASAGAFNAVVLATALVEGGRSLARERLERFWRRISQLHSQNPFCTAARFAPEMAAGTLSVLTSFLSPYQFNPFALNPMRKLLTEEIDFRPLCHPEALKLLVAATSVRDGKARIFRNDEINAETILASSSLPLVHHAVRIGDDSYWDGGYSANPPLIDLVMASFASDILTVQIIPTGTSDTPKSSHDIIRRLGHITFNASLQREMSLVDRLIEASCSALGPLTPLGRKLCALRRHQIVADDAFDGLTHASEMDLSWTFLLALRDQGRRAADMWLRKAPAEPVQVLQSIPRVSAANADRRLSRELRQLDGRGGRQHTAERGRSPSEDGKRDDPIDFRHSVETEPSRSI